MFCKILKIHTYSRFNLPALISILCSDVAVFLQAIVAFEAQNKLSPLDATNDLYRIQTWDLWVTSSDEVVN